MLTAAEDAHDLNLQEFSLKLHNDEIDDEIDDQARRVRVLKSQFVIWRCVDIRDIRMPSMSTS
jgi:hypothetical protein